MDTIDIDCLVDGIGDAVGMVVVSQMVQHVHGCVQHGDRVGNVLAGDGRTGVTGAGLEDGELRAARKR